MRGAPESASISSSATPTSTTGSPPSRSTATTTEQRSMKLGINLYLWTDHMHDGLLPVLESLKRIGYDGVEVPIFDLDEATWAQWGRRLDDLGLERTANTVIAPEWNPLSPDPAVRQ